MSRLVARRSERRTLDEALRSPDAELIAVYGRRRVGKTFLIREAYARELCFELVGTHEAELTTQLRAFSTALGAATRAVAEPAPPPDWQAAFGQLSTFLTRRFKRSKTKHVVLFDEVPWLSSRRSGFLSAFEHFWNT